MRKAQDTNQSECRRCGVCCGKGGPALHLRDKTLVESGVLALEDLFTIRRGEPVHDNVVGVVSRAATDIIKIKGRTDTDWTCLYYRDHNEQGTGKTAQHGGGCLIYENRPLECHLLECRYPTALITQYNRERLQRSDLLSAIDGLFDLVTTHQARCDFATIGALAKRLREKDLQGEAGETLMTLVRYDLSIRQLTVEKSGVAESVLPVLFGRPLTQILRLFGLRFMNKDGQVVITAY